ncbi:MAG: DMT family transporter [Defluviitaleaceae bacterium]|nr:DMT family transporter [Defluviitaleaceae bacterium]MCL2836165.1 DMT family transporter [Defluviitaleaceae bacterium]
MPSQSSKETPGAYLVIFAVLCTSASSIFIRLSGMPPLAIAFYRMLASAAFLAVPFIRDKNGVKSIKKRDLILCGFSGIALALHFATWIVSLTLTTVTASTVLVSLSPIFVAIINMLFFRKKPGKILFICLALAISGTVIISAGSFDGNMGSLTGNALALAGAFFVAVYLMIGQDVRKRVSTAVYAFLVYGFAAAALLVCCLAFAQPLAPYGPLEYANIVLMALVCSIGGHTLYNMLLKFHGAALISLASLGEPVFASILAVIILSEPPPLTAIAGGVLVVAGVAAFIVKGKS